MKYPKNWNKMSLIEQENWLVKKLTELYNQEVAIKKMLGKVRGGQKINIVIDERPDLLEMKDEN
jgi:hypothetical protein